ncbi:MAG: type II secretion system protein GspK [Candidatus Hydrogenedentes bacterium]|nr:type II secretion system protein GspK [Candidatus Hydrogenedentota bacterium]
MKRFRSRRARLRDANHGVALLTALAFLFLFSMLGAALVRSISIDLERTETELAGQRAAAFARGGVEAAIGEIAAALVAGEAPSVLAGPVEIQYPVYRSDKSSPAGIGPDASVRGRATFTVTDESGKININHATPRVLKAVLGVDGNVARAIRGSLPLASATGSPANRAWFTDLSELSTRGLVPAGLKVDSKLVTVYSVVDHNNAEEFLNVNAAPAQVLAAVLDIPLQAAQALADRRPFRGLQELCEAAGKDPAMFNGGPGAETAEPLGKDLAFQSRCFRIVSEGVVAEVGPGNSEFRPTLRHVEAVVVFDRLAGPQVTYWSERAEAGEAPAA